MYLRLEKKRCEIATIDSRAHMQRVRPPEFSGTNVGRCPSLTDPSLADFLAEHGLQSLEEPLAARVGSLDALARCSDLKELGLKLGHRLRLQKAFATLSVLRNVRLITRAVEEGTLLAWEADGKTKLRADLSDRCSQAARLVPQGTLLRRMQFTAISSDRATGNDCDQATGENCDECIVGCAELLLVRSPPPPPPMPPCRICHGGGVV